MSTLMKNDKTIAGLVETEKTHVSKWLLTFANGERVFTNYASLISQGKIEIISIYGNDDRYYINYTVNPTSGNIVLYLPTYSTISADINVTFVYREKV